MHEPATMDLTIELGRERVAVGLAGSVDRLIAEDVLNMIDSLLLEGHRQFVFELSDLRRTEGATAMLRQARQTICSFGGSYAERAPQCRSEASRERRAPAAPMPAPAGRSWRRNRHA